MRVSLLAALASLSSPTCARLLGVNDDQQPSNFEDEVLSLPGFAGELPFRMFRAASNVW